MYKNYKIESEMQISEADFTSFADVGSEDELRAKITKIEEKFEKIKRKIQEIHS